MQVSHNSRNQFHNYHYQQLLHKPQLATASAAMVHSAPAAALPAILFFFFFFLAVCGDHHFFNAQ
jgi:hypothetical protein